MEFPNKTGSLKDSSPLLPVIDHYKRYYASGSGHTARGKQLDIQRFLNFLLSYRGCKSLDKLKVGDWDLSAVNNFIEERLRKGEAPATVSRRLATIKHMGRTLADKVPGFVNPAKEARPPKVQTLRPQDIPKKELQKIKSLAEKKAKDKDTFAGKRDYMIFKFLLDTGLRVDEIRELKFQQLSESLDWISNVRTKGKKYRNVYITSDIREELGDYLKEREDFLRKKFANISSAKIKQLPVFLSLYGAKIDNPESFMVGHKSIWRAINSLSVNKKLHPHLLRHTFAHDLLEDSNDIRLVAQALGHSDVRITMRYTERTDKQVAEALEKSRRKKS